jgi:15-cis-phytoene synthase
MAGTGSISALPALRGLDADRYFAALFVPPEKRQAFAALAAFRAELARIPQIVSEPMPGEIRLQWWRDVISGERAGEAAAHPVAGSLVEAIAAYRLPSAVLERMAEARIHDLYHDPLPDRTALEGYLGETEATLIQCQILVLASEASGETVEAAGHAGMAVGIAEIIRALPVHARRGQSYMPLDMQAALGLTADMLAVDVKDARSKAVSAWVALGRDHLNRFRDAAHGMPPAVRPAFLPVALATAVLKRSERAGAGAFSHPVSISPFGSRLSMTKMALYGF